MLHSTYYSKETNEDPKTSAIFENLCLLPDNVFWNLLRNSCFDNQELPIVSGPLLEMQFWAHWDSTGTTNTNYVEPDVFLRFESFDVIIEAKVEDGCGQYQEQWKNEIKSYLNVFGSKKQLLFIAVGGNSNIQYEKIKVGAGIHSIVKCSWSSILMQITKYQSELESISIPDYNINSQKRILHNLVLAFNINGLYNIKWFGSMMHTYSTINNDSIISLTKYFSYE